MVDLARHGNTHFQPNRWKFHINMQEEKQQQQRKNETIEK